MKKIMFTLSIVAFILFSGATIAPAKLATQKNSLNLQNPHWPVVHTYLLVKGNSVGYTKVQNHRSRQSISMGANGKSLMPDCQVGDYITAFLGSGTVRGSHTVTVEDIQKQDFYIILQ